MARSSTERMQDLTDLSRFYSGGLTTDNEIIRKEESVNSRTIRARELNKGSTAADVEQCKHAYPWHEVVHTWSMHAY